MNPDVLRWRDRLCCPACGAALETGAGDVSCGGRCGARLLLRGDVPVLIDPARSVFSPESIGGTSDTMAGKSCRRRELGFYERRSADRLAEMARLARAAAPHPAVLIIGGGQPGSGIQVLLDDPGLDVLATDVYVGPYTRLVCDAHALPFRTATVDAVVIQAVLEHVLDPAGCVAEIHRVLRPGGLVHAETPFMQQVHMGAYDFTRWTPLGHRRLFRMFDEVASGITAGPGVALAWAISNFMTCFSEVEGTRRLLARLAGLVARPAKWMDRRLVERRGAPDGASGCYFLGRRREAAVPDAEIIASYRGMN